MQSDPISISYNTAVRMDAGWRQIYVCAEARPIGRGLAEVVEVTSVDGHDPEVAWASRTGAYRQSYSPASIARRELGKRKRVSACEILD